ncbi:hypothetical protein RUND412_011357 [Rhizina undulata]
MKFTTLFTTAATLIPAISAHLIMYTPQQWFVPTVTGATVELSDGQQNPLLADGSNYPCHGVAPEGSVATYEPGSFQTLQLQGTAVHGGGSGQMSITYDTTPTKDSIFRVMTSWEGDMPGNYAGNISPADASYLLPPLQFKVPAGLPAGTAVVAWTWFNKIGNREMYMQCATVTISGSETSTAAFEALPEMFRANSGNGCTVPEDVDAIAFKHPGPYVIGTGTTTISCDDTTAGTGSGASDSTTVAADTTVAPTYVADETGNALVYPASTEAAAAGDGTVATTTAAVETPTTTAAAYAAPTTTSGAYMAPTTTAAVETPTSTAGSYVAPTDNAGAYVAPTTTAAYGYGAATTTLTTMVSYTSTSSTTVMDYVQTGATTTTAAAYTSATAVTQSTTSGSTSYGSSSTSSSSGTCVEGKITCNSDGTWSMCGSGINQNMGDVAAGMTCSDGAMTKRSIRFSLEHKRRRRQN